MHATKCYLTEAFLFLTITTVLPHVMYIVLRAQWNELFENVHRFIVLWPQNIEIFLTKTTFHAFSKPVANKMWILTKSNHIWPNRTTYDQIEPYMTKTGFCHKMNKNCGFAGFPMEILIICNFVIIKLTCGYFTGWDWMKLVAGRAPTFNRRNNLNALVCSDSLGIVDKAYLSF